MPKNTDLLATVTSIPDTVTTGSDFKALVDPKGWFRPESGWSLLPQPGAFTHTVRVNRTRRVIGWFQSLAMGGPLPFHSFLELDWLRLLDASLEIERFLPQPPTIEYRLDGETRAYTADTLVVVGGAAVMVEVKFLEDATDPENLRRWPAIRDRFAAEGYGFRIATEAFIQAEPRRSNVAFLRSFRSWQPTPELAFQIATALQDGVWMTLGDLAARFPDPVTVRQFILGLVLRRYLAIDLGRPIGLDSAVWLPTAQPSRG